MGVGWVGLGCDDACCSICVRGPKIPVPAHQSAQRIGWAAAAAAIFLSDSESASRQHYLMCRNPPLVHQGPRAFPDHAPDMPQESCAGLRLPLPLPPGRGGCRLIRPLTGPHPLTYLLISAHRLGCLISVTCISLSLPLSLGELHSAPAFETTDLSLCAPAKQGPKWLFGHVYPPHACWWWPLVNDSYQHGALLELF